MAAFRVTQVRSSIGIKPKHRGTLRALGLGRIGKSHTLPDRPEIRGMLAKVPHLVTVSEIDDGEPAPKNRSTKATGKRSPRRRGTGSAERGIAEGDASSEAVTP